MSLKTMHYPFVNQPLPYDYAALEPRIDAETLHIHHDKHLAAYVANLNKALEPYPALHSVPLERLISPECAASIPEAAKIAVRNHGGGVYNHFMYFDSLSPVAAPPSARLEKVLCGAFGSVEECVARLAEKARGVFGSGYAWLAAEEGGAVRVVSTPNQDIPLWQRLRPLLALDVWEHAYYLKYRNVRGDYVDAFLQLINWENVEKRYYE
jgi:Fe-Mn family superoxide dismutase